MNPRERLLTTLRGDDADRVPLVLQRFHCASLDEVQEPARRDILARGFETAGGLPPDDRRMGGIVSHVTYCRTETGLPGDSAVPDEAPLRFS